MPELRYVLAEHRLAFSAERFIEGKHATSAKGVRIATCHSEAYMSLLHRQGDIKAEVRDNPEVLEELAQSVMKVRSSARAVKLLGLDSHPSCQLAKHVRDPIYMKVIYHADPWTKYNLPEPLIQVQRPGQGPAPPPHQSEASASLYHHFACQHLHAYCGDEGDAGVFVFVAFCTTLLQNSGDTPEPR